MHHRSRSVLLVLVVALALLAFAATAQAATVKVVKGNTQMNMDKNVVKNLVGQNVVVDDISPATLTVNWTSGINWFFNVPIYTGASGTVAEAIEQFKTGKLAAAATADVEGHWA